MVSTGFDGTIRKWNLKNMQMESMMEDKNAVKRDKIIQSLVWCSMEPQRGQPADMYDNLLVIGTSSGNVKLLDLGRNRVLSTISL